MLNVVDVFNQAIPCRFDFVELSGNHVEPCVGFVGLFDAQGDHAAHVALGVDVGEFVCHGVTLVDVVFFVYFFRTFFSLFFDGLESTGWHGSCSLQDPCQPPGEGGGEGSYPPVFLKLFCLTFV